jgi:hypothetical protein
MEPVQSQNAPPIGSAGETRQAMNGLPRLWKNISAELFEITHSALQDLYSSKSY